MIKLLENEFELLAKRIRNKFKQYLKRVKNYFKRLLFPIYFFPIKLFTYSLYYFVFFSFKFVITLTKLVVEAIIYPFLGLKNFLKFLFVLGVVLYMAASLFVITDYLRTQYGEVGKFFCSIHDQNSLKKLAVRVIGSYSEGSGFFISPEMVITNFHVISGEPSPKIILADGSLLTPTKILGDDATDIAVLEVDSKHPELVIPLKNRIEFNTNEKALALGYPLGTELSGAATIQQGSLLDLRDSKHMPVAYVQTDINLIEGMSGGPLLDQCGNLIGINTMGLSGLSLFIAAPEAYSLVPNLTDAPVTKIEVDPSASPADAVTAFYTYLKARRMEDGFNLLSAKYLEKTNFQEWTNRFSDILDVTIFSSSPDEKEADTAKVKFSTKNWVDGEVELHYYEGTWQTVNEDGVFKMNQSKIMEVENPSWDWFYE